MSLRLSLIIAFIILFFLPRSEIAQKEPDGNLTAVFRNGQTFLTWPERGDLTGEKYRVYWDSLPITAETLPHAQQLATLAEGSNIFYANRSKINNVWGYRYFERLTIADNGAMLSPGTGLFVRTAHVDATVYYAVTIIPPGGSEQFDPTMTSGAVIESAIDPKPVHTSLHPSSGAHVYIQYMDTDNWNSTFHAPNATNQYYGLNGADARFANTLQYAYDYVVVEPKSWNCNGSIPTSVPVILVLHGYGANMYEPYANWAPPYCAYFIYPYDQSETWWFGFAHTNDYRTRQQPAAGDIIVNYTEQRILRMIYDLIRAPISAAVDLERIYVYGHSMGGSGTLALALRYPDVFAAAYSSQPMTNYRTSTYNNGFFIQDASIKWGSPALNLPVWMDAPGGWNRVLMDYEGTGVWDWQNHQEMAQVLSHDFVPFGVAHGMEDDVIDWQNQGAPFYPLLDDAGQTWAGAITDDHHHDESFDLLPPTLAPDNNGVPFAGLRVKKNETVPGFANASSNPPFPDAILYRYNTAIRWAATWNTWDEAPVDNLERWEMSFCAVNPAIVNAACGSGSQLSVDVTLRRVQHFGITDWLVYRWENRRVSDGALVASGNVEANRGKITVDHLNISPQGNRLIIFPAANQPNLIFLPLLLGR